METGIETPPVNEVVLSVAFEPQDALVGPVLSQVLGEWFNTHSSIQLAPPIASAAERQQFSAPTIEFRFVDTAPAPRYWFVSKDEREVIQVQSNYLALGWRRREPNEAYVRYATLRARFIDLFESVSHNIANQGGRIEPTRAEITYLNVIQPSSLWTSLGDVHKVLKVFAPSGVYEQFSLSFTRALTNAEVFRGRLKVNVEPVMDWLKEECRISLGITGRSAELEARSLDSALDFLDLAHDEANLVFSEILTDVARKAWGYA
jgi:uncharacterized protein (TIGR04255 family)